MLGTLVVSNVCRYTRSDASGGANANAIAYMYRYACDMHVYVLAHLLAD